MWTKLCKRSTAKPPAARHGPMEVAFIGTFVIAYVTQLWFQNNDNSFHTKITKWQGHKTRVWLSISHSLSAPKEPNPGQTYYLSMPSSFNITLFRAPENGYPSCPVHIIQLYTMSTENFLPPRPSPPHLCLVVSTSATPAIDFTFPPPGLSLSVTHDESG